MKTKLLTAGLLSLGLASVLAAPLDFSINPSTGAIVVKDSRNGRVWEQELLGKQPAQRLLSYDAQTGVAQLECEMLGIAWNGKAQTIPFRVTAKVSQSAPEMELTFVCSGTGNWRRADYPYAFTMHEEDAFNLYPHGEGMLVPVKKSHPDFLPFQDEHYYGGIHSLMACFGVLELKQGAGVFTILPNFESTLVAWKQTKGDQTVPQFAWRSNKGVFDRPNKMHFSFYDQGGYVAMAQRYRQWFAEVGLRRTLAEKAAVNPNINKMAGTTVFWPIAIQSAKPVREMADLLKANGVERCLLGMPGPFAPQSNYPHREELASIFKHVQDLGYIVFRYDQFRDAFRPDPTKGSHVQINTDAWPDLIAVQENGTKVAAFGEDSGVICPKFFLPLAKKHLPTVFAEFPYEAWYLDCLGSVSFNFEADCFHPEHPADNFDAKRERLALLEYVESLGKLTSTECGLDYLIPHVSWFEGATTLIAFVETFPPGTAAALGAKDDNELWKSVSKAQPGTKVPWTISLSTKYRIPFWSLAHHDEAVNCWRIEDGMHEQPAYWARKNLWSALYAAPPMYRPYDIHVRKYGAQMGQTARYIGHVTEKVGLKAMTDHRFLTEDRDVQETRFEGNFGVIANFAETAYRIPEGPEIPAGEYVAWEEKNGHRTYLPPPSQNVFANDGTPD